MKILVVSVQGIGNTILTIPAIKYLCSQRNTTVDAIVSDSGVYPIVRSLEILRNIYLYKEKDNFIKNLLRLKKEIKANNYDIVYAMYPNGRRENLLSFYLSKKSKGGVTDRGYWSTLRFLLREKVSLDKNTHDILNNLRLVGVPPLYQEYRPLIVIPPEIEEDVKRRYFLVNDERFLLVVHPFSGQIEKCWEKEKYKYICRKLIETKKAKIIVVGAPYESEDIDNFVNDIGEGAESFCQNNILEAAAVIKQCNLFLGNDSSLMHISSALGRPTISIWGFTDCRRTAPYGGNSLIIRKDLDCSPCYSFEHGYRNSCPKNFDCLNGIDERKVYEILSYAVDYIRKGQSLEPLDFKNIKVLKKIDTLCLRCKMLNL